MFNFNDIDYSKWQRKDRKNKTLLVPGTDRSSTRSCGKVSSLETSTNNVARLPSILRKECSTRCRHGSLITFSPKTLKKERRPGDASIIPLLKAQIKEKKASLLQLKRRYIWLISENLKLRDEVTTNDEEVYSDVKELLTRYQKYKTGFCVLQNLHERNIEEQRKEFVDTVDRSKQGIQVLQQQVDLLDSEVNKQKLALKILLDYKEREYPEKVEQIKLLKSEIEILEKQFDGELNYLAQVASAGKDSFVSDFVCREESIKAYHAEAAIQSMDVSTRVMAQSNSLLKKEIAFHQNEYEKHTREIEQLVRDIRNLKAAETLRLAKLRHPELSSTKCPPDAEIQLDIPVQKLLPI